MKKINKVNKWLSIVLVLVLAMAVPGIVHAAPVHNNKGSVERIAGKGRMETAVEVSKVAYKNGSDAVVLAGYHGEVDALTGTLLANAKKAPILLTEQKRLSEVTKDEIIRLNAKTVYILGGESVVSKRVATQLAELENVTVKTVDGNNRFNTAHEVAKTVGGETTHVFLALGEDEFLADALTVGPVSALNDIPILLTTKNYIPQETKEAMKSLGVTDVTIVGGENAISKDIEKELKEKYSVDRVSGTTREQTAQAIATCYFPSPTKIIIANDGRVSYADALVGGYLGALMEVPILLTQINVFPETTKDYMEINNNQAYILGGESVVSKAVETAIEKVVAIEKKEVLEVKESVKLSRNYKTVNVTKDEVIVDLNGKIVETLIVTSNKTTIKKGTVINIVVGKDVTDVIFDDIIDDGNGIHEFEGGGAQSIVLKGKTQLKSNINISSATPIQIRAENLEAGKGMTGKVSVNTESAVTIAAPVKELEVKKENKAIKINAEVGKVSALANATITVGKDIKMPTLEKAKGVTAIAKDSAGKAETFEENEKLEPTVPVAPEVPSTPTPDPRPDSTPPLENKKIYYVVDHEITEISNGVIYTDENFIIPIEIMEFTFMEGKTEMKAQFLQEEERDFWRFTIITPAVDTIEVMKSTLIKVKLTDEGIHEVILDIPLEPNVDTTITFVIENIQYTATINWDGTLPVDKELELNKDLLAAIDKAKEESFSYTNEPTVEGLTIFYTPTNSEDYIASEGGYAPAVVDLAQILGALYRINTGIDEIEFEGFVYYWNSSVELLGGSWKTIEEEKALVDIIANKIKQGYRGNFEFIIKDQPVNIEIGLYEFSQAQ